MKDIKNKKSKTLSIKLTVKQYSDFWYIAGLLGESAKKPAFIKMLSKLKEVLEMLLDS